MAKRFGQKVSKNIQTQVDEKPPELPQHLVIFFQAFKDLSTQRSVGFAVGYIPYLDILTYARAYNFSEELEQDLIFFVRGLDEHYLQVINNEQQKKNEQIKQQNTKNSNNSK